jgi:signal transduction histidine kinase
MMPLPRYGMPTSQVAFLRSTALAIVIGLAALVAIVAATLWLVGETRTYSEILDRARQERAAVATLHVLALEAETGERGYLLTGDETYLQFYEAAIAKIGPQLRAVRSMLMSEDSAAAIDRLVTIGKTIMDEAKQTVDLAKTGRRDEALAIFNTNRTRDLVDEEQKIFVDLIAQADRNIGQSIERQQEAISRLRFVIFAGALTIIAVTAGNAFVVLRYTRRLAQARRDVEDLNAGLEERVRERTADLGRANEEVQRFAYIVTHDLRAPLVNIMGFTSELETSLAPVQAFIGQAGEGNDPVVKNARLAALEDLPEAISFIRSSTRKMDGLINAILKLSREGRRTLKPEKVDLDAVLHAAVESIRHQLIDANGEVTIEAKVNSIISDRLALDQIFGNLLDNAVKYRDPSRPLSIKIHTGDEGERTIFVTIEDNGRGIAKQDHERVFELFRRSGAQDQRGEGIGLAHVRAMARNLGGDITLSSELGHGTVFKIILPKDLRKITGVA